MDRRLKERLIGAAVLVAIIVIIVPELLSGPRRPTRPPPLPLSGSTVETLRNVTVDLATSKPTQAAEDAAAIGTASVGGAVAGAAGGADPDDPEVSTDAVQPVEAPSAEARSTGAHKAPSVTTLHAQPSTGAVVEKPVIPPKSESGEESHRAWTVQIGSFAARANADKLAHHLRLEGYAVSVSSSGAGQSLRYRVRTVPLPDRGSAEHALTKLKAKGYLASLVPPAA